MKVLFQSRLDILTNMGGDSVQIAKTKEELEKLGVEVVIDSDYKKDLAGFDLVHIFGLQWLCEPYFQLKNARKQKKKVILSPIHHSEVEVKRYENLSRYSMRRLVNMLVWSQQYRDLLKNLWRSAYDLRRLPPVLSASIEGYRNQQRKVLQGVDKILVQTDKEGQDLNRDFGVKISWEKVKLGVGEVFTQNTSEDRQRSGVIVVGRIEPRKNQLKIIEALDQLRKEKNLNIGLTVIGGYNKNNNEYFELFEKKVKGLNWISYIPSVKYEEMPNYYRSVKVCASASWFETTGLSLIEAVICGCAVVAPGGDTGERIKEYLGDIPHFCDPGDVSSIKEAIFRAYTDDSRGVPQNLIQELTWSKMAENIFNLYNGLTN